MSDDPFGPPELDPYAREAGLDANGRQENETFPWDNDPPPDPDAPRERHDAFTPARKNEFLRVLVKTGCIREACRRTEVAPQTVYRHQGLNDSFFDHCVLALRMSGTPVEITAWQRAVDGVEEQVVVGGKVQVRRRYSEGLLRMLLQGSNPEKYGPRPGFKRKRLLKHERKQIEREVRAEYAAKYERVSFDDAIIQLEQKLIPIQERQNQERLAAGWTQSPAGDWVPPGYAPIPGYVAPPAPPEHPAPYGQAAWPGAPYAWPGASDPRHPLDSM